MNKVKLILKDKHNVIFLIILLIAIIVRIVLLGKIPNGIHEDEAGMMYDAYCMAEYGTDRYLNENPVYLGNFGGGQSVLYAAIASIFIKIFGLSVFVIRLPIFILSIITIILSYLLAKKFINKNFALVLALLITVCPWHIIQSRWGLDCNLFPAFLTIALYVFLNSKKDWHYIIAGICWGLTLYTYALSYIMLPILFVTLCIYMLYTKSINFKQIIITIIPILFLAIPLILVQLVNMFDLGTMKIGFITIPQLFMYRIKEIGFENILYNLNICNGNNFWKLLFSADHNQANSFIEFGTIYYILIPFAIFGFILTIKKSLKTLKDKTFNLETVFLLQFIVISACVLLFRDLQLYKLNLLFITLLVFITEAIIWLYEKKRLLGNLVLVSVIINFVIFEIFYFEHANEKAGIGFTSDLIPLIKYMEENYPNQKIYLETDALQQYIYLLLAKRMSPYEFMEDKTFLRYSTGETEVIQVGRYHFISFELDKDMVYVIETTNELRKKEVESDIKQLEDNGFTAKKYNNFFIYTYQE